MSTKCITDFDVTYGSALAPAVSHLLFRRLPLSRIQKCLFRLSLRFSLVSSVLKKPAVLSHAHSSDCASCAAHLSNNIAHRVERLFLCLMLLLVAVAFYLQGFHRITTRVGGSANLNTTSSSQQSFLWTHEGLSRGNPVIQVGGTGVFSLVLGAGWEATVNKKNAMLDVPHPISIISLLVSKWLFCRKCSRNSPLRSPTSTSNTLEERYSVR